MTTQHRIAALESWAQTTDRAARTQPARDGLMKRFEREVDAGDPQGRMSPEDRAKAIEAKRRAFYMRMAQARHRRGS